MKRRVAFVIIFVGIHLILITGMIVLLSFYMYPDEEGYYFLRAPILRKLHDELKLYKEEKGAYPESLDSLLQVKEGRIFFQSKEIDSALFIYRVDRTPADIRKIIHYELIDNEPVLTDLGRDANEGGLGLCMDVVYPRKYQKPFPFWDFIRTGIFWKTLAMGLVFSGVMSLCLFGMWAKQYKRGRVPFYVIILSVLLVLFELIPMQFIMILHIYPHH